jgi:hypothetical protein
LDNNLVERPLKRAVLHRKNALFYRTLNGAQVGDLFMTLIHTCQLCCVNSFEYLVELQRDGRKGYSSRVREELPEAPMNKNPVTGNPARSSESAKDRQSNPRSPNAGHK